MSARTSVKCRFLGSPRPSEPCHSQNRPSTVAEEDFFRFTLTFDAAPGIRREGDANLRIGVAALIVRGERTSDHFQFVSFYRDGDRAFDGFNGDYEVFVPTLIQNSLQAIQTAASNPDSLSELEKSMEGAWNLLRQEPLQIFDLLARDRNWFSPEAHQANDSCGMEEFYAQCSRQFESCECVPGEKRDVDGLTAIAPAVE